MRMVYLAQLIMRSAIFILIILSLNIFIDNLSNTFPGLEYIVLSEIGYYGKSEKVVVWFGSSAAKGISDKDISEFVILKSCMIFLFSFLAVPVFVRSRFALFGILLGTILCVPMWTTSLGLDSFWAQDYHPLLYPFLILAIHSTACWFIIRGDDLEFAAGWTCIVVVVYQISYLPDLLLGFNYFNHHSKILDCSLLLPLLILISWNLLEKSCSEPDLEKHFMWHSVRNSGELVLEFCPKLIAVGIICSFLAQTTQMSFFGAIGLFIDLCYLGLCPMLLLGSMVEQHMAVRKTCSNL